MKENNSLGNRIYVPAMNLGSPDRVPVCISIRPEEWRRCQQLACEAIGPFGLSVSDWATLVVEEFLAGFGDTELLPLMEREYFGQSLKWSSLLEAASVQAFAYIPDEECVDTFLIHCDRDFKQSLDLLSKWLGVDRNKAASALLRCAVAENQEILGTRACA